MALVTAWVEAFNAEDVDRLASFYAEDAVNHQVTESPLRGGAAIRRMFADAFATAEMVCIVENLFEAGLLGQALAPAPAGLPAAHRMSLRADHGVLGIDPHPLVKWQR